MTYTYGIVNWTEQDIKSADILVRKMLHMNRMFEIRSDVDRLYIPRNNGGRGLVSLWDSFKTTNARLAHFLTNSPSQIITKCSELDKTGQFSINKKAYKFHEQTPIELPKNFHDNSLLKQAKIVAEKTKNALQKQRYEACLNKPQHGVYFKLLDESQVSRKWSMSWLTNCHMAPQTESFIFAAQELALFTKWHERFILKKQVSDLCRVCMKKSETMSHILSGCDSLAKKEYLDRHNGVAQYVHHSICKNFGFQTTAKWHTHKPKEVLLSKTTEIIWDSIISTERPYVFNRPDIIIRDKKGKKTYIIDISCPNDINVSDKEQEKITKYSGLRLELGRMWDSECVVVPVVIGGLGVVSENFERYLKMIPAELSPTMCIKTTLLGSEKILRRFLSRR